MSWNVELARIAKDLTFDAGIFIIFFVITFVSLLGPKKPYIKLGFMMLAFSLFTIRGGEELIAISLLNYAKEAKKITTTNRCWYKTESVVILGSGLFSHELPSASSLNRVLGALEIHDKYSFENKAHQYFFSGGYDSRFSISEAEVMANYFRKLGGDFIKNVKILEEKTSANTYENAFYINNMFNELHLNKDIILVTSDYHFMRASAVFDKMGFKICNWPVPSPDLKTLGIFNFANGEKFSRILNEYFGIFGYWFRGWL